MTDLSLMLVFVCLYSVQSPSLSALCILELDFDRLSIPDLWFLTGYGQWEVLAAKHQFIQE